MTEPFVSVVVPFLRDTPALGELLETLENRRRSGLDHPEETVVVNGDPNDDTIDQIQARYPDVRWTTSSPGRGRQMNAGAALSTGRWILFLHADSCPDPGWLEEIREVDIDQSVVGGAFVFRLCSSVRIARLLEWGVALRVFCFGLPYGDQGLVIRRTVFNELGGFETLPIMEDVDLVRRLKRRGQLARFQTPMRVSARRWEQDGWVRRTCLNIFLFGLYCFGVAPDRLVRYYAGRTVANEGIKTISSISFRNLCSEIATSRIGVVIPALNEEEAIEQVLNEIPNFVSVITVVDNGSTDATAERARASGAHVVTESQRGYGRACLAGLRVMTDVDVVVFLDADRSDYPEEMTELVMPILQDRTDVVMGVRSGTARPPVARFGTALCIRLINFIWHTKYQDLGPFRAIRREALDSLGLNNQTWGWTIEMQVKAVETGLRVLEVPIRQRSRIGQSKISGTLSGTIRAGTTMLSTIWSLWRSRSLRLH